MNLLAVRRAIPADVLLAALIGLALGVGTVWISPFLMLAAVLGLPTLVAITHRPELGLLLIVVITAGFVDADRLPYLHVGSISLQITDMILLYLLALVTIRVLLEKELQLVQTPLDLPILLFFIAMTISVVTAMQQPSVDMNWIFRRFRPLAYYLSFFAVTNLIRDQQQLIRLLKGLFLIAVMGALVMLVQVLFPSLQLGAGRSMVLETAGETFNGVVRTYFQGDRLINALFPVSMCLLIARTRRRMPAIDIATVAMLVIGIFLTFQRNYWIIAIANVVLLTFLVSLPEKIRVLRWTMTAVILLSLLAAFGLYSQDYMTAASDRLFHGLQLNILAQDPSTQMRLTEIGYALDSIARHPWLGIGLGNFYRPAFENESVWGPNGLQWYIHNAYLWIWIDAGLAALVPFVLFFGISLLRGFSRWYRIGDPTWRAISLGVTVGILGQVISNLVAPNFVQSWILVVFPILLGVNEVIFRRYWATGKQES